jgi:HK97 family phage major capsid protein
VLISKSDLADLVEAARRSVKVTVEKGRRQAYADPADIQVEKERFSISKYLKGVVLGDWTKAEEEQRIAKALSASAGTAGGFLVPDTFVAGVIGRLRERSILASLPNIRTFTDVKGALILNRVGNGATVTWGTAENASMSEDTSIDFKRNTAQLSKASCLYKMSRDLLDESGDQADAIITDEITAELALEQDRCAFDGTGGGEPLGLYRNPGILNTDLSGSIDFGNLVDAEYQLRAQNARLTAWVCSPRTLKDLVQLKDGNGRNLWQPNDAIGGYGLSLTQAGNLFGRPVFDTTEIAITNRPSADETFMLAGQWDRFGVAYGRMRIESTSQGGESFEKDQLWIKVVQKFAAQPISPEAFVVIKGIQTF